MLFKRNAQKSSNGCFILSGFYKCSSFLSLFTALDILYKKRKIENGMESFKQITTDGIEGII